MAKMTNRGPTKRFLITEMDRSVKRMLKLIEDEGDSFAKKAEIYIQKRPELVSQVEEFYRMFKALAERYDDATCELRRTLPPDCRSQSCGMSDICSEPPSAMTSPEHRFSRRLSGTHAAFLDYMNKGYETSNYDSGSDPDDSFYNSGTSSNYGNYRRLRRKITELEGELKKAQIEQEVNQTNPELTDFEAELRSANEKFRLYELEIRNLKSKLEQYESVQHNNDNDNDNDNDNVNDNDNDSDNDNTCLYEPVDPDADDTEDEMDRLRSERDEFEMKLSEVEEELRLRDDQIDELNNRLQKLQVECERSSETIEELEKVIEKQREMIEEGAEEKRQTEAQLCISLEHYRNAYQMLRKGLLEQKKPVMAS